MHFLLISIIKVQIVTVFDKLLAACVTMSIMRRERILTNLFDTKPIGHDAVHCSGVHLCPLEFKTIHSGFVLPECTICVVVELWSKGLA